ncbi:MAG TPA: alpha/beta hydrolase [Gemmatimonadales bacterium]|nr:alpha/beta hydrolase [Gemmatimonadales bacterium]
MWRDSPPKGLARAVLRGLVIAAGLLSTRAASGRADPIDVHGFVRVGGIQQWVAIRGEHPSAPVILVVHGGPGAAWSGFPDSVLAWEHDFRVVRWDQRGAGLTYGRSGPVGADVTIDRMARDGIEVAEYVRSELHVDRILLMGISWGSVVGVRMAKLRPDLFAAYIGVGQVVNWPRGQRLEYAQLMHKARVAQDSASIRALQEIGPPPYHAQGALGVMSNLAARFEPGAPGRRALLKMPFSAPGYSAADAQNWLDGLESSQDHFIGKAMDGPFTRVDLARLGLHFELPVFIVQGSADDIAPASLARSYLRSIRAPHAEYLSIAGAGHYAFMTRSQEFQQLLLRHVRPLATSSR